MKNYIPLLFLFVINFQFAFSQNCDSSLNVDDNLPYGYKSFKNRCEGFYAIPVSSADRIDLIGLTLGKLNYVVDSNEVITITSGYKDKTELKIRAQTVPLKIYYRMDASLLAGDSIDWPVRDIILPNYLTSDRIRILGWIDEGETRKYIPIVAKSKLSKLLNNNSIYITFRPSVNVENIQFNLFDYKSSETTDWVQHPVKKCRSGMPINLNLELNSGIFRLTLSARVDGSNDEWIESQIVIDNEIELP